MKAQIALVLAILTTVTTEASAQVFMLGIPSCGSWVNDRLAHSRGWLAGYLSGVAANGGGDFLRGSDFASLELWMEKYCRENPLDDLNKGANLLIGELQRKKGLKR